MGFIISFMDVQKVYKITPKFGVNNLELINRELINLTIKNV